MNLEYDKLIEECNSKRANIYYNLKQLIDITGLSTRMLKYKMKKIKFKYQNVPSLLTKSGRSWKIHISIVNEFMPLRNRKARTTNTYSWKSFATWNMKNSYDTAYHTELINQIKAQIGANLIKYTIEEDRRNIKHIHFISDASKSELLNAITQVLNKYLPKNEYRLQVNPLNNKYSAIQYIGKSPLSDGIL